MARTDRDDPWAQTNSLLLLGIVDLLEEKGLLDKDQFLERLATFKEESIDIGLFLNSEDELRGDAGYHCGGQQVTVRMAERIGLYSEDRVLDAGLRRRRTGPTPGGGLGLFDRWARPGVRPAPYRDTSHAIGGTIGQSEFQIRRCGRYALRGQ